MKEPELSTQLYPGLRVGSVELVAEIEPRDSIEGSKHFRQWEVLCDCGGRAYRTVTNLVIAIKRDQDTCCEKCLQELRRGLKIQNIERSIQRGRSRTDFLIKSFKKTGSLYVHYEDPSYEWNPDLDTVQFDTLSLNCLTYENESNSVNPDYHQQDQWLSTINNVAGWICYHCETPFTKGFGCVRCLTRICESCKNSGAHCCPTNWVDTWKDETKDPGLLDRRIKLLEQKYLKLTTRKDIETVKKSFRDSYIQWKWEQKQTLIKELKDHANQQKIEAKKRREAELLEKSRLRSESMAQRNARWEAKTKIKENTRTIAKAIAKEKAESRAKEKAESRAKEKAESRARGITRDEKARLAREARRKSMHVKSLPKDRRLLDQKFFE